MNIKKITCLLFAIVLIFTTAACKSKNDENKLNNKNIVTKKLQKNLCTPKPTPNTAKNVSIPVITPQTKVAYLSFDDGPSPHVTKQILKTLDKYKIKATFFIVGNIAEKYPKVVKQIYDDGNSIGNHSYSHVYKHIYASWTNLYNEVSKTNNVIYKITGAKCDLFRAPGGSKPFMTDAEINSLHSLGIKLYDWNCTIGDGTSDKLTPNQLFNGFLKSSNRNHLYILMHCKDDNFTSAEVLPRIIEYLKNKGYMFLPIKDYTKEIRFIK
jgi:peptidoglycan/xylan/chitin deacetylase (PgdA/CDA1 family)